MLLLLLKMLLLLLLSKLKTLSRIWHVEHYSSRTAYFLALSSETIYFHPSLAVSFSSEEIHLSLTFITIPEVFLFLVDTRVYNTQSRKVR